MINISIIFLILFCSQLEDVAPQKIAKKGKIFARELLSRWNHFDQKRWCHLPLSECCMHNQSPIALSSQDERTKFAPFKFSNYEEITGKFKMINNGHTIALDIGNMTRYPRVERGGLPHAYKLHSLHFHWGSDDSRGAEHAIDNKFAPLELHLLHINVKFRNGTCAKKSHERDALAVFGVMYYVDDAKANAALYPLTKKLKSVAYKQLFIKLPSFNVGQLLPQSKKRFFRYIGSMTTPNCSEIVVWTVFEQPSYISRREMDLFRTIRKNLPSETDRLMVDNFRELQERGFRKVYLGEEDHK